MHVFLGISHYEVDMQSNLTFLLTVSGLIGHN